MRMRQLSAFLFPPDDGWDVRSSWTRAGQLLLRRRMGPRISLSRAQEAATFISGALNP